MWAGDYYVISDSDGNYHGEFLSYIAANEYVYQLIANDENNRSFTIHHSRESYKESFRGRLSLVDENIGNLSLVE